MSIQSLLDRIQDSGMRKQAAAYAALSPRQRLLYRMTVNDDVRWGDMLLKRAAEEPKAPEPEKEKAAVQQPGSVSPAAGGRQTGSSDNYDDLKKLYDAAKSEYDNTRGYTGAMNGILQGAVTGSAAWPIPIFGTVYGGYKGYKRHAASVDRAEAQMNYLKHRLDALRMANS